VLPIHSDESRHGPIAERHVFHEEVLHVLEEDSADDSKGEEAACGMGVVMDEEDTYMEWQILLKNHLKGFDAALVENPVEEDTDNHQLLGNVSMADALDDEGTVVEDDVMMSPGCKAPGAIVNEVAAVVKEAYPSVASFVLAAGQLGSVSLYHAVGTFSVWLNTSDS